MLVDDAHGFGTLGETGAGAGEAQGVQDQIDLYFSTFAKSMASIGAFVAGPKQIIDYVRYNIRSLDICQITSHATCHWKPQKVGAAQNTAFPQSQTLGKCFETAEWFEGKRL